MSPKYLETLRIPLRRGRMFTQQEWADSGVTGRVAVINEYMAQKFWKTADEALGKRFRFGSATDTSRRWITIIGVAADIRHGRSRRMPDLQGYMPYRQGGWNTAAIVVRTRGEPAQATSTVLSTLKQVDPLVPAYRDSEHGREHRALVLAAGAVRKDVRRVRGDRARARGGWRVRRDLVRGRPADAGDRRARRARRAAQSTCCG